MGHIINEDIIIGDNIKEPAAVSLAANSNFLQIMKLEGNMGSGNVQYRYSINSIAGNGVEIAIEKNIDGTKLVFKGTTDSKSLNRTTFLILGDLSVTAENLRRCLLAEPFLRNNYNIDVEYINVDGNMGPSNILIFKAKKEGNAYGFKLTSSFDGFILKENILPKTAFSLGGMGSGDSDIESVDCDIEVDIYLNDNAKLGQSNDIVPNAGSPFGTYATTFSKAYWGQPLWFDVNVLPRGIAGYSDHFLTQNEWCDAGTVTKFRLTAARYKDGEKRTFYISDMLYALNGYARTLDKNLLSPYVYNPLGADLCLPLTTRRNFTHVRGQAQFFNFVLSNPGNIQAEIGILYKAYTQSRKGIRIDIPVMHQKDINSLDIVNTLKLDLDMVIDSCEGSGAKVGIIEAYLSCDSEMASEPMIFTVLPDYLYEIRDFAFLNRLGGWSSFSFGAQSQTEFKSSAEVVYATLTPEHEVSGRIETVYRRDLSEQFTVQTMPITRDVAEWLKEISASTAVYEFDGENSRYVVVDELVVKHNTTDDLFRIDMKYHYSDSYNAQIVSK